MRIKHKHNLIEQLLVAILLSFATATLATTISAKDNENVFAPKLIHQPLNAQKTAGEPHTIECPVEPPDSQVKWFKNGQLLANEPGHMEQTGPELMFVQVNTQDAGDYVCVATNNLGTITSNISKLTVLSPEGQDLPPPPPVEQSQPNQNPNHDQNSSEEVGPSGQVETIRDLNIRLEPEFAEVSPEQQVEFTCTLPVGWRNTLQQQQQQQQRQVAYGQRTSGKQQLVSWRKNGRSLQHVVWLDGNKSDEQVDAGGPLLVRFFARQVSDTEFVLLVTRILSSDDNSTFSCVAHEPTNNGNTHLARQSNESRLRLIATTDNRQSTLHKQVGSKDKINFDVDMGPPIDNLIDAKNPRPVVQVSQHNQTTNLQLDDINNNNNNNLGTGRRRVSSLGETLRDLYEITKPTLIIFSCLSCVGLLFLLQLFVIRRRTRQTNRYMKHNPHQFSVTSGGSSGSSGGTSSSMGVGPLGDCDPVLSSLLSRTLSAPSASSLVGNAGKKYKSYRDHMRKVAAVADLVSNDFVDAAYFNQQQQQQQQQLIGVSVADGQYNNQQQQRSEQLFANSSCQRPTAAIPNLYNQSLAAREQARTLLQAHASEHMRSLSNLSNMRQNQGDKQTGGAMKQAFNSNNNNNNRGNKNGSHSNLPFNFGISPMDQVSAETNNGPLELGASQLLAAAANGINWPPHLTQLNINTIVGQQQGSSSARHVQATDEHYQLVSCSSVSPSSASSTAVASSSSSAGAGGGLVREQTTTTAIDARQRQGELNQQQVALNSTQQFKLARDSLSSNHYSTIGTNEDDEGDDNYEELDVGACSRNFNAKNVARRSFGAQINRTSTFLVPSGTCDDDQKEQKQCKLTGTKFNRVNSYRNSGTTSRNWANNMVKNQQQQNQYSQEQLSPYAVSSICDTSGQVDLHPPPRSSEAMRALNEQFDVEHLVLLNDDASSLTNKPNTDRSTFDAHLPPPPPPPPNPPERHR